MVNLHVANHDNDPAASLAAITAVESVSEEIRREVADADVHATLAYIPATEDLPPRDARAFEAVAPAPAPAAVRYRKVRDHARGGLGVVFVAHDERAEPRGRPQGDPGRVRRQPRPASRRFLLEAEITGGLEHPGIVPVYGLGPYDDGRPFYAMRFIRGDSLKDAIAAFHADRTFKHDPAQRRWRFRSSWGGSSTSATRSPTPTAGACCTATSSPTTSCSASYGETLVVDWGLAKAVGRGRRHRTRRPARVNAPSSTRPAARPRRCPAR